MKLKIYQFILVSADGSTAFYSDFYSTALSSATTYNSETGMAASRAYVLML
jgi:hypothetical protein